ncbi:MAG TPA: type II toxin-antitoxin system VapC family toxin [Gemmataceae bacterium]|nr:type II toxin-antitoxin system VapC family toxin [Gemmataceae bacterium]
MAWILDTDHLSILQRRSQPDYDRLQTRLQQQPLQEISTTIVSFQEQVRGWLSYLNQARDSAGIIRAYAEMHELLGYYCRASVLPFHRDAQDRFADLRHQRIRVATTDLRIACIALTAGATLLSRNLRDFRRVPGLTVEDWTR